MIKIKEYFKKYLIGDVAHMFKISPGLIRHYEKIGLINSLKEDINNYRHYNIDLIEQISNIVMLRSLELSLDEINQIQSTCNHDIDQSINILENHIEINNQKILYLRKISQKTKKLINDFQKIKINKNKIEIRKSPKLICISLSNILDIEELARNHSKLISKNLFPRISFFLKKEKLMDHSIDFDAYSQFGICVEYNKTLKSEGIILPGRDCAYSIFIGKGFENIGKKYKEMLDWIYENNYYPYDDAMELGFLCIGDNYIIEIYIPIK